MDFRQVIYARKRLIRNGFVHSKYFATSDNFRVTYMRMFMFRNEIRLGELQIVKQVCAFTFTSNDLVVVIEISECRWKKVKQCYSNQTKHSNT